MAYSPLCTAVIPVPANHHSGVSAKCYPFLHDIECPPGKGWARSLASSYMQNPATQASIHYIVDAADIVGTLDEVYWAWGSGSPSSKGGIHVEQAGYASFTTAMWLGDASAAGQQYQRPSGEWVTFTAQDAADMRSQYALMVKLWADICTRYGWDPLQAATQGSLQQMVNGADLGQGVRHRDATAWVGGTTHTDPGNYPWVQFIADVNSAMHGAPPNPTPVPPTPPTPDPEDIWEWIMTLPDAPKTWAQARRDIANEVALMLTNYELPADPTAKAATPRTVERGSQISANRVRHGQNYDGTKRSK